MEEDLKDIVKPINQIELANMTQAGIDNIKLILGNCYEDIISLFKNYVDMKEEYYDLVALWIIGTYLHEGFETYPYLFANAMRGSGKTRFLKLVKALAKRGELLTSLRESVLFRDAKGKTLCIDEFESIGSKENQALRELLNACYKKGMKVKRMKRKRTMMGEEYVVEEFEPYTPICMANIWGMEEVLADRCLTLILEKSSNQRITRLMEDFEHSVIVTEVRKRLEVYLVYVCSYFGVFGYMARWNLYINDRYNYTTTYNTYTTLTTQTTQFKNSPYIKKELHLLEIFNKIYETKINGRNLELMMPLFLIADFINPQIFEKILKIAEEMTNTKKDTEMMESRDVMLIDFVSQLGLEREFKPIKVLTQEFRSFAGDEEGDEKWINSKWIGKAFIRLSLVIDKRRMKNGMELIPNVQKAIEKIKSFRKEKKDEYSI